MVEALGIIGNVRILMKHSHVLFTALVAVTMALAPLFHIGSQRAGSELFCLKTMRACPDSGSDAVRESKGCCDKHRGTPGQTPADRSFNDNPVSDQKAPANGDDGCPCCVEVTVLLVPWFVPDDTSSYTLAIQSPAPFNSIRPDGAELDSLLRPPIL